MCGTALTTSPKTLGRGPRTQHPEGFRASTTGFSERFFFGGASVTRPAPRHTTDVSYLWGGVRMLRYRHYVSTAIVGETIVAPPDAARCRESNPLPPHRPWLATGP